MITITIILALILLIDVSRLYVTYRKPSKKDYFKARLDQNKKLLWDLEFKVFKMREVREDVRREYDGAKSRIYDLDQQIQNPAVPEDTKPRMKDDIERFTKDSTRYEAQMKQIDLEINGSKPTAELPDGYTGIIQQMDSIKEISLMLEDWIANL